VAPPGGARIREGGTYLLTGTPGSPESGLRATYRWFPSHLRGDMPGLTDANDRYVAEYKIAREDRT
jgi:hypothetical protein